MNEAFQELTNLYTQNGEAADGHIHPKSEWKTSLLAKGIVDISMRCIGRLLMPDFPPSPQHMEKGIFRLTRHVIYRGCRIEVFGTESIRALPRLLEDSLVDKSREAICLCILPHDGLSLSNIARTTGVTGQPAAIFPMYPNDIDALACQAVTLEQLIEYKLFRRILAERDDPETQYSQRIFETYGCGTRSRSSMWEQLDKAIETHGELQPEWLEHPYLLQIDAKLTSGVSSLLIGYSSAGKTVLAFQAGQRRQTAGWTVRYVNMADTALWPSGVVQEILFSGNRPEQQYASNTNRQARTELIIADDLQSKPLASRLLLTTMSLAQTVRIETGPIVLGVSWKDYVREANRYGPEFSPFTIHARLVQHELIGRYLPIVDRQSAEILIKQFGDDIYLFRLALQLSAESKSIASYEKVAAYVWNTLTYRIAGKNLDRESRRIAIIAGTIGQFDIQVPKAFLARQAGVSEEQVEQLVAAHFLRQAGEKLTLGHRSLSSIIVSHLTKEGAWQDVVSAGGPKNVSDTVLRFLNQSGTSAMIDALRALVAKAGFRKREALSKRAHTLIDIWKAFEVIVERVEQQQLNDPSWSATPSSVMFAANILREMGREEMAEPSLRFLREHCTIDGLNLILTTKGLATEKDFVIIRDKIVHEDAQGHGSEAYCESATELDFDRFHKTWLAGLILSAECKGDRLGVPREKLAELVEGLQLSDCGAFYPKRVPWCTARVLLGLAANGRTIANSSVVKRATEWLLRDRAIDGAMTEGVWKPGTGGWNSVEETTSLVLLALVRAGVDPTDSRLNVARDYLMKRRPSLDGLDAAVAIDALLAVGVPWYELADDTSRVARWVIDLAVWRRATLPADKLFQQTCSVAQTATHLVSIGWMAIRQDIAELLDALDLPDQFRVNPSTSPTPALFPATESVPEPKELPDDPSFSSISHIKEIILSSYCVVGDYSRFEERTKSELRLRYEAIHAALKKKSLQRENFLLWSPPGSGKSFFIEEIAKAVRAELPTLKYSVLNLAKLQNDEFAKHLDALISEESPVLCMIDEFDSRKSETWPYEVLFPYLDCNKDATRKATIVFVLVGSSGTGLHSLVSLTQARPKGSDLIDRVPEENRFEIPRPVAEDRLVVFVKQLHLAASQYGRHPTELERLAAYYLVKSPTFTSPRQITELAGRTISRMPALSNQVLYTYLFRDGDRQLMQFYADHVQVASELQGRFLRLGG